MDSEIYWNVVKTNDARFDGAFYLGVKTTGIYCRPSCRARTPKRENVAFRSWSEAENFGLRLVCGASRRMLRQLTSTYRRSSGRASCWNRKIFIRSKLAAELDLSPYHLQRSFKEIISVSPKKYSEAKRMERFKSDLRNGSEVTAAMYDAGFGSSSRLYTGL